MKTFSFDNSKHKICIIKISRFAASFRGISLLGLTFFTLRWFK